MLETSIYHSLQEHLHVRNHLKIPNSRFKEFILQHLPKRCTNPKSEKWNFFRIDWVFYFSRSSDVRAEFFKDNATNILINVYW